MNRGVGVVRILLVEPMNLLRRALATVLSADDVEVTGALASLEEALFVARRGRPDILLVNVGLLTNADAAVLRRLDTELTDCAVVALVEKDTSGAVTGELNSRVRGFVGKEIAPEQLAEYLRRVAAGERVIDPTLAVAAWQAGRNPLTAREVEILRIAAKGVPPVEIAATLHLSAGTVRNYLSSIIRKTNARNRLEAVRAAEEAGWL